MPTSTTRRPTVRVRRGAYGDGLRVSAEITTSEWDPPAFVEGSRFQVRCAGLELLAGSQPRARTGTEGTPALPPVLLVRPGAVLEITDHTGYRDGTEAPGPYEVRVLSQDDEGDIEVAETPDTQWTLLQSELRAGLYTVRVL